MHKTTRSAIVSFVLAVLYLFALPAYAKYNGGTGDPCDPYQINDPCQLNAIGTDPCDWGKHFVLTADIDLSAYTGEQFNIIAPDTDDIEIGFQGTAFTGSFDGNGHTVSNFTYTNIGGNIIGLFGYVGDPCSYAVVKDLTLADPCIVAEAGNYVGSVIGWLENGIITGCGVEGGGVTGGSMIGSLVGHNAGSINNCYATGNVSGGDNANNLGGLVGESYNGIISDSHATGSVSGGVLSIDFGGLLGHNRSGIISNCYATGNVSGGNNSNNLGGLIGYNDDGSISNCYATGDISDGDYPYYFGGLVGYNSHGNISDCYAAGSISGGNYSYYFGGLVGYNEAGGINNCYAICSISGRYYLGGLVGHNWAGSISNCYVTGSISGDSSLGGLVGCNETGSISNCYATSSVSGDNYIGGLIGWNLFGGSISNCYATGSILGGNLANYLGGLVGYDNNGSYISSFWNTTVDDPYPSGVGNLDPDPSGVIGETTANMQIQSTFTDEGWDFVGEDVNGTDNTWRMCVDGIDYPKLFLEFLAGDIACPDGVEINDLMYLIDYWLEEDCPGTPGCPIADINADNEISMKDFTDLAANWLLP